MLAPSKGSPVYPSLLRGEGEPKCRLSGSAVLAPWSEAAAEARVSLTVLASDRSSVVHCWEINTLDKRVQKAHWEERTREENLLLPLSLP